MKRFVASADSETDENIWETVEAATEKAPVNQFIHSAALADAQFRTVVTPNVDPITFLIRPMS